MKLENLGRFYQSIIQKFDKIESHENKSEVVNLIEKILFNEEVERQRKNLIKSLNEENDKLKDILNKSYYQYKKL